MDYKTILKNLKMPDKMPPIKKVLMILAIVLFLYVIFCVFTTDTDHATAQLQTPNIHSQNKAMATRLCATRRNALYGIFSTVGRVKQRNAARQQTQCNMNSDVYNTVFVIGVPQTQSEYNILNMESKLYGDVFILTCVENMNEGKTYTYFKEAIERFPCFDFYAKVDDDTAFAPAKLSAELLSIPNDMALIIGRIQSIDDMWLLSLKWVYYGFRDLSWAQRQNYTAGCLYVLNTQAIKQWMELNPLSTQFYGDEDVRTSYYMDLIGAKVINLDTKIHDYMTAPIYNQLVTWKLEITNTSLAVHKCKNAQLLSDAFASICA
jgi:hypothetical protein